MAEAANRQDRIPLFRPRLPDRRRLAPYLDEIDRNRWYTNFGPLARRFEARLAARFGLDNGGVVTTAKAAQEGLLGAVIKVRAVDNKRVEFDATVTGPAEVRLGAATTSVGAIQLAHGGGS
ncbi:MAG: hypothetical protein IIB59_01450 [Planctomycetes bacterium]|nr:hypothetical protein [Planctomycetota bacterium]